LCAQNPAPVANEATTFLSLANRVLAGHLLAAQAPRPRQVSGVDLAHDASLEAAVDVLDGVEPDVLGFSCHVWNFERHLQLADALKARRPRLKCVFGGPQVALDAEDLEQVLGTHPGVDWIVQGEGERALERLLATPPSGRPPRGSVIAGVPLETLAPFPAPLFELFPFAGSTDTISVDDGRGCPFRCAFCNYQLGHSAAPRWRGPDYLASELGWALRHGIRWVTHAAPGLNYVPGQLAQLVAVAARVDPHRALHHEVEIDYLNLTPEDAVRLAELNAHVGLGVQSTNPVANRIVRRRFVRAAFERAVELCKAHGVQGMVDIILGLPGDRLPDFEATLDYVLGLDLPVTVFVLRVLPGTELYARRRELGLEFDVTAGHRVLRSASMAPEDIEAALAGLRTRVSTLAAQGRQRRVFLWDRAPEILLRGE